MYLCDRKGHPHWDLLKLMTSESAHNCSAVCCQATAGGTALMLLVNQAQDPLLSLPIAHGEKEFTVVAWPHAIAQLLIMR
jgi:hypothetical protein